MKCRVTRLGLNATSSLIPQSELAQAQILNTLNVVAERLSLATSVSTYQSLTTDTAYHERLKAAVSTIGRLDVMVEMGDFLVTYFIKDNVLVQDDSGVLDQFFLEFFKTLNSTAGVAEHAVQDFRKVLRDVAGVADLYTHQFVKNVLDTALVSDAHKVEFAKALQDQVTGVEDQAYLFAKKVAAHYATVSDFTDRVLNKWTLETLPVAEQHRFDTSKAIKTTGVVIDAKALSTTKGFFSKAGTTDSHSNGLGKAAFDTAGASEDETFQFGKSNSDVAGIAESQARAFSKALQDESVLREQITHQLNKALQSRVGATDDFDGAASLEDDQELHTNKATTSVVGISEFFVIKKVTLRDFFDDSMIAELFTAQFMKQLTEMAYATDTVAFNAGKVTFDIAGASDQIYTFDFSKPLTQIAAAVDAEKRDFGKALTDQTQMTDSGFVRSQNYSDFSYFAEDFVGTSRTF